MSKLVLPRRSYVIVPSTDGLTDHASADKRQAVLDYVATQVSLACGGATAYDATGYYVAQDGQLIQERATVVEAYHDGSPDAEQVFERLARYILETLHQESVAYSVNGELTLVFAE